MSSPSENKPNFAVAARDQMPLAIVGMACRVPGARDLDEFWNLALGGGDATGELPSDVLDRELYYDPKRGVRGKSYSLMGGLMPRLPVDNDKLRLDPKAIANYDPAHLATCEVAYDALCDAGYDPHALPQVRSGVYFGHTGGTTRAGDVVYSIYVEEMARMLGDVEELRRLPAAELAAVAEQVTEEVRRRYDHWLENPDLDCAPNRLTQLIASTFSLDGPCVVVDAACASSLQALALGARSLRLGESDMVVVGGASCCKSDSLVLFSAAQSVSAGQSRPFDKNATGLVTAEGIVVLVLKTLPRALADGDRIRCLIRGIGMASDGRGKSLWAPLKDGQGIAIQRAYPAPLTPQNVQYVEAHATSTQVGDATELSALAEAFRGRPADMPKVRLGSVKANIGHTLETAGVAGLAKAVLAIEHQTMPPVANLSTPNPAVPWEELPFQLPTQPEAWPQPAAGEPRRAAVNSFGIGGLNVHVLLEEYLPESAARLARQASEAPQIRASETREPIAIIGMGVIVPGAQDIGAFWRLLQTGQTVLTDVPPERWDAAAWVDPSDQAIYRARHGRGGFLMDYQYDWRRHKVPPKQVANANPLQFMLLDATEQALAAAGYPGKPLDADRVGVIVGTMFGGDFANQLAAGLRLPAIGALIRRRLLERGLAPADIDRAIAEFEDRVLAKMPALLDETGSFTSSTLASRITKTFNLKGGAMAMDAGYGSALAALSACVDVLRTGECDMMICATGQRNMDFFAFQSLTRWGFLAEREPGHAFDATSAGLVPGEGCITLLMKRLSDAKRDGDEILGVISGIGCSADFRQDGVAIGRALERAIDAADAAPEDIRAFETLAATPELVQIEVERLQETLAATSRTQPAVVNALASQFGFLGGAHGMAGVLRSVLSIKHGEYAPGAVATDVDPRLPFSNALQPARSKFFVPRETRTMFGVSTGEIQGAAYSVLLESGDFVDQRERRRKSRSENWVSAATVAGPAAPLRIARIGAGDWGAVQARLQRESAADIAAASASFGEADRARVAIVYGEPAQLESVLAEAAEAAGKKNPLLWQRLASKGVYFGEPHPVRRGVAFVFPGQGSQHPGMLSELIRDVPEAGDACRRMDSAMRELGYGSFDEIAGGAAENLGSDIWATQVAMLLADTIVDDTLRQLGLKPCVVAGHSFGEYAAIVSANGWSGADAIRATRRRYESILMAMDGDGAMAASDADEASIEHALRDFADSAFIANRNAPDQTVIGGRKPAIEAVAERLRAAGHTARLIKVPCAFHTPLMAPAAEHFAHAIRDITLRDPHIPVVSTAGLGVMGDASQLRASLIKQLTEPVRYAEVLSVVLAHKPALVVEAGPRQTLTQLNKKNYHESDVVFIASDVVRRPGAKTLLGVVAQAECLGCMEPAPAELAPLAREKLSAGKTTARAPRVLVHDATERRYAKMRSRSEAGAAQGGENGDHRARDRADRGLRSAEYPVPEYEPHRDSPDRQNAGSRWGGETLSDFSGSSGEGNEPTAFGNWKESAEGEQAETVAVLDRPQPVAPPLRPGANGAVAKPRKTATAPARRELQEMLVGFVVEQTGYPEDIVEMDADLEADLGIDSIKKAQLFGEVGERFQLSPREDMSLDDFPTLGHVLDFLVEELEADADDAESPHADGPPADAPAGKTQAATASLGIDLAAPPAPQAPAPAEPAVENRSGGAPARQELQEMLVGFVVEQTGYPEDIVEMDADLEADLGIDSIKKAQLFGEVGERFQLSPREDMSLDDFPTLGHVLDFLVDELSGQEFASQPAPHTAIADAPEAAPVVSEPAPQPTPQPEPTSAPAAADAPSREELQALLVGFVVEQTGYPEDIVEMDADLEADLGIDSIKKAQLFGEVGERFQLSPREDMSLDDFPTLNHVLDFLVEELAGKEGSPQAATPAPAPAAADVTPVPAETVPPIPEHLTEPAVPPGATKTPSREELQALLVGFVVEQTGYPEDIVELDADLEADLGIDSIKKAQLFGEVGERFQLSPREDMSLDDFPTLNHVLDFLVEELAAKGGAREPSAEHMAEMADEASESAGVPASVSSSQPQVRVEQFVGDLQRLGAQHGAALTAEITHDLAAYLDEWSGARAGARSQWSAEVQQELSAIAEAAGVNVGALAQWNRVAEPIAALPVSFGEKDQRKRDVRERHCSALVHVRKPSKGAAFATLGRPGKLAAPVGINAARLVVSYEPLSEEPVADDSVALAEWMRRQLGGGRNMDQAANDLCSLSLQTPWSVGLSVAGTAAPRFFRGDSTGVCEVENAATPEQHAVHTVLSNGTTLALTHRHTGAETRVDFEELLPLDAVAQPQPPAQAAQPAENIMQRHVLRMSRAPRPASGPPRLASGDTVCLVGDSPLAVPMRAAVEAIGCVVQEIGNGEIPTAFDGVDPASAPQHVVCLTEFPSAPPSLCEYAAAKRFAPLLELCRRWIESLEKADRLTGASLVAVTAMGGDFGLHSGPAAFGGGGLTGMFKGIRREFPAACVKALDFSLEEDPRAIVQESLQEIQAGTAEVEIGFFDGHRYLVHAVEQPLGQPVDATRIAADSVWVVTGGGRGVTFEVARELGRRYGVQLHLLGTMALPEESVWRGKTADELQALRRELAIEARRQGKQPGDLWRRVEKEMELDRNLARLRADGIDAYYHVCDITDRQRTAAVLNEIRLTSGPVTGVLHGAGVEAAARFTKKKNGPVRLTIAAKCDGAANLMALTENDPLEFFVSFGSTSGRFGGLGQADYSLASDLLAKMTSRFGAARPACKAVTFHWPAWAEVGMAARPESRVALELGGVTFMPVAEGVRHLITELQSDAAESEIVILDKPDGLDLDGTMSRAAVPADPAVFQASARPAQGVVEEAPKATPTRRDAAATDADALARLPLIDALRPVDKPGRYEATVTLQPEKDPFLVEHRFRKRPLLPGVMSLELFAEAAWLTRPELVFAGIRDFEVVNGWSFESTAPQEARVVIEPDPSGGLHCELRGKLSNSRGQVVDEDRLYARAVVDLAEALPTLEPVDPGRPVFSWTPFSYAEDFEIYHGPPLRAFTQLDFVHGGGRATITCGSPADLLGERRGAMLTAPAALDGCMVACGTYSFFMVSQRLEIPQQIASYRQARAPRAGEQCTLRFFLRELNGSGNLYDFALVGDAGDTIFAVEGYRSVQPSEAK